MDPNYGIPLQVEEVKAAGESWEVAGYVSTFGNVDLGYDVVLPGAFDRTLSDNHKIRFLYAHDQGKVLGVPTEWKVDDRGLFGRFKISKTPLGEEVHTLLKDGAVDSFSIGYRVREWDWSENGDVRQLKDIDLFESSLVAMPMNERAVVAAVKADLPADQLILRAKAHLDLAVQEAKALHSRRDAEGRKPADRILDAEKALHDAVKAAAEALEGLRTDAHQAEAMSVAHVRLEIARRRLKAAGVEV